MKISKVGHANTAVGIVETDKGKQISGMIYQYPSTKERMDLEERFKSLNKNAKNLYSIFNQVLIPSPKKGQDEEEYNNELELAMEHKKVVEGLNRSLSYILFKKDNGEKVLKNSDEILKQISHLDKINVDVSKYTSLYLRKSLRKQENAVIVLISNFGNKKINKEDQGSINQFLLFLSEDFNKDINESGGDTFSSKIKKSIEHKNMIVQPKKEADHIMLGLSDSKARSKTVAEKEGFDQFLKEYATLTENDRMDLLRRLRRLVDLYFYKTVNIDPDYDVWAQHTESRTNKELFVEVSEGISKKETDKHTLKVLLQKLREDIRQKNISCYRYACDMVEQDTSDLYLSSEGMNRFWIHHMENSVERILKKISRKTLYRLENGYLSEKVWKDCLNYLSIKYIAIGKAVYHFTMDELMSDSEHISVGIVSDHIKRGITSFDYEIIKANETLQREVSVAIAFAANNLARATVISNNAPEEKKEDFLLWDKAYMEKHLINEDPEQTMRNILQFFGGASSWDMSLFKGAEIDILYAMKDMIYSLRNENFHFRTENTGRYEWNQDMISKMFEKDVEICMGLERKRFYSNNLPKFYKDSELEAVMNTLYKTYTGRASQVPSFHSVFVRKDFPNILSDLFGIQVNYGTKDKEQWQSAVYYLMKEIYYNGFLSDSNTKDYFEKALKDLKKENLEDKQRRAVNDFSKRCRQLLNLNKSFSEICQLIMTEYNAQNDRGRKVKSNYAQKKNPDIFRHYKMLLFKTLRYAMKRYITGKNQYKFISSPKANPELEAFDEFLPDWQSEMYKSLITLIKDSAQMQCWYIAGRFLNGRSLSLLAGSLRSFIQYTEDVEKRAKQTKNSLYQDKEIRQQKKRYVQNVVQIIDMCTKLSSVYSNDFHDYFTDDNEYAMYLSHFLKFMDKDTRQMSPFAALDMFCNESGTNIDIYMDGHNPIMNRNIIMSKLFAPSVLLENIIERTDAKVSFEEIIEYYNSTDRIQNYRTNGICKDGEEQKEVIHFQKLKNHIEFRDIVEYSEIINELQGQLINWSYMRERDLLYFQLGFHYYCLNNSSLKPEGYKQITGEDKVIDQAILYQFMAMYINGISIYSAKKKGNFAKKSSSMSTGGKINAFLSYTKQLMEDTPAYEDENNTFIYNAGLELFENINEHDDITALRDKIDHFKYYTGNAGSMLDMYSEVFDRFFSYDMKYQKTVINQMENILLRHFVIMVPAISTGEKNIGKEVKACAKIDIRKKGLSSDRFTYKCQDEKLEINARDQRYLSTVAEILYYPSDIPAERLAVASEDKRILNDSRKGESEKTTDHKTFDDNARSNKPKYKAQLNRPKDKAQSNRPGTSSGFNTMADLLADIKL